MHCADQGVASFGEMFELRSVRLEQDHATEEYSQGVVNRQKGRAGKVLKALPRT
jgi:hypothetical protein